MQPAATHPAQVAGLFYPAEANRLRAQVAQSAKQGLPDGGVTPKLVVAPHAGVVYSGAVAASAFGPWARRVEPPSHIVIIGPAHRAAFRGLAIHPASRWTTPLGEVPVAVANHDALAQTRGVFVDARPFVGEHSLEMHLVMLQAMLPAPFAITPILVGDADPRDVAEALRRVWGGPETVIAVSSDLSHFLDCASAESIDADTAGRIETLDAASLDSRRACGFLPIQGALDIAAERDMRISRLHLANSADAGAGAERVVGYGAFAFEYAASARLADDHRAFLLSACRRSIEATARGSGASVGSSPEKAPPALAAWRATFVTLTQDGRLRGCIGSPAPRRALVDDAVANAAQAAQADPRFPPLEPSELHSLRLDLSVLSHPRTIAAGSKAEVVSALEPDRDGLILRAGRRRAIFLPSVWREIPDAREFVRCLMEKAGLAEDEWPAGIEAKRFQVESFGAAWRAVDGSDSAGARDDEVAQH